MPDRIEETQRMLHRHQEVVDRARAARAEHADDTYAATSADRTVSVTVDASGRLTAIEFQQTALNRGDPARLGRAVLDAVTRAQSDAAVAQVSAFRAAVGVPPGQLASAAEAGAAVEAAARRLREP